MFKDDDDDDENAFGVTRYPCMPSLIALQQMRNRLQLATLGKKLMKWTAMATGKELRNIAMQIDTIYKSFSDDMREAFIALARCRYFHLNVNKMVVEGCPSVAEVLFTTSMRTESGVKIYKYHIIENNTHPYEHLGIAVGGQTIQETKRIWLELLKRLILMVELRSNFALVEEMHNTANKQWNNNLGQQYIVRSTTKAPICPSLTFEEIFRGDYQNLIKNNPKTSFHKNHSSTESEHCNNNLLLCTLNVDHKNCKKLSVEASFTIAQMKFANSYHSVLITLENMSTLSSRTIFLISYNTLCVIKQNKLFQSILVESRLLKCAFLSDKANNTIHNKLSIKSACNGNETLLKFKPSTNAIKIIQNLFQDYLLNNNSHTVIENNHSCKNNVTTQKYYRLSKLKDCISDVVEISDDLKREGFCISNVFCEFKKICLNVSKRIDHILNNNTSLLYNCKRNPINDIKESRATCITNYRFEISPVFVYLALQTPSDMTKGDKVRYLLDELLQKIDATIDVAKTFTNDCLSTDIEKFIQASLIVSKYLQKASEENESANAPCSKTCSCLERSQSCGCDPSKSTDNVKDSYNDGSVASNIENNDDEGCFENNVYKSSKVRRFRNPDGTMQEEIETIVIKRKKQDPSDQSECDECSFELNEEEL